MDSGSKAFGTSAWPRRRARATTGAMQTSGWAQAFRGFDDWEDDHKRARVTEFLNAASGLMPPAKVVGRQSEDQIELRGTYANYPTRVMVDTFFDLSVEMKAPNPLSEGIHVTFDPQSAPSPGDVDPWDEGESVRVFLAKCVYVEASANEMEPLLRRLQALPAEFRQYLFSLMQGNALSYVTLTAEGPRSEFRANFGEMWDPMTQLTQVLWLLAYGANVCAALPPQAVAASSHAVAVPATGSAAPPVARAKCRYCTTVYLWGPHSACPNCGAPYTG